MPADVSIPLHPPSVTGCPNVPLPRLAQVLPWTGSPPAGLQTWALAQLRYPLGTVIRDTVGGVPIVARIECHFAYGAHPELPGRWHKGCSVYRPAQFDADGSLTPITTAPQGWPASEVSSQPVGPCVPFPSSGTVLLSYGQTVTICAPPGLTIVNVLPFVEDTGEVASLDASSGTAMVITAGTTDGTESFELQATDSSGKIQIASITVEVSFPNS